MGVINRQHLQFLMTGLTAALVNLISRYILSLFFSFNAAVILAYVFGMLTAFVLMKFLVFKSYGTSAKKELARFLIVNMLSGILVVLSSNAAIVFISIFSEISDLEYFFAHLFGVGAPIFLSFFLHKNFTFRT